uniref:t-SNARE coiled-coil homology domain-containing protein n=1 Tax=Esox lucius TaxID=8010 RepID=A0AAY5LAR5_ESOLU
MPVDLIQSFTKYFVPQFLYAFILIGNKKLLIFNIPLMNKLGKFTLTVIASIVESNPKKFNLDALELTKRKGFITSTRHTVKEMKDHMSSPSVLALSDKKNRQALLGDTGSQGPIWQPGPDKYTRLDQELRSANSQFIEEQQTQQQLMAEQQDDQLELVSGTIGVLKNMSERIGMELDEQAVMLDDFSHEMDGTHSRLDNVMKKLAQVSNMTTGGVRPRSSGGARSLVTEDRLCVI